MNETYLWIHYWSYDTWYYFFVNHNSRALKTLKCYSIFCCCFRLPVYVLHWWHIGVQSLTGRVGRVPGVVGVLKTSLLQNIFTANISSNFFSFYACTYYFFSQPNKCPGIFINKNFRVTYSFLFSALTLRSESQSYMIKPLKCFSGAF